MVSPSLKDRKSFNRACRGMGEYRGGGGLSTPPSPAFEHAGALDPAGSKIPISYTPDTIVGLT